MLKKLFLKCIGIITVIGLLLMNITSVSATSTKSSKSYDVARAYLLSIGTPESDLSTLPDHIIEKRYNSLKGKKVEYVGRQASVRNMDEKCGSNNSINDTKLKSSQSDMSYIQSNKYLDETGLYDSLYFSIDSYACHSGYQITSYITYVDYCWQQDSWYHNTDSILVNWDKDSFNFDWGSFSSESDLFDPESGNYTVENTANEPALSPQGGVGWYAPLYERYASDDSGPLLNEGDAEFTLNINSNPIYDGSVYSTSVNAEYVHNYDVWTPEFSFGIDGNAGVTINKTESSDSLANGFNLWYSRTCPSK